MDDILRRIGIALYIVEHHAHARYSMKGSLLTTSSGVKVSAVLMHITSSDIEPLSSDLHPKVKFFKFAQTYQE